MGIVVRDLPQEDLALKRVTCTIALIVHLSLEITPMAVTVNVEDATTQKGGIRKMDNH